MRTLKLEYNKNGEPFFCIDEFSDMVDISKVTFYSLEEIDDDGKTVLLLKFYDENRNIIEVEK